MIRMPSFRGILCRALHGFEAMSHAFTDIFQPPGQVRFGTAEDEDGHEEGPAHYASVFEYDGWVGHVNDDEEDGAVEYRGNSFF